MNKIIFQRSENFLLFSLNLPSIPIFREICFFNWIRTELNGVSAEISATPNSFEFPTLISGVVNVAYKEKDFPSPNLPIVAFL